MEDNKVSGWYNYRTQKYDYIETPKDFSNYVPQIGGLGPYKIYVEHDHMEPIEACLKVFDTILGDHPNTSEERHEEKWTANTQTQ